jgi:hypothetical protein
MAKKMYPVLRKFTVTNTTSPAAPGTKIELDRLLSEGNRRLYRQSYCYTAKVSLTGSGAIAATPIYALAPTWWVLNAIKKAREHFDAAMKEEVNHAGKSRWHDFRLNLNLANVDEAELQMISEAGLLESGSDIFGLQGEYINSTVRGSDGLDKTFKLFGATSGTSFNIFTEYDRMGSVSGTPSASTNDGGYNTLMDALDEVNVQHLQDDGNLPPYDSDRFPEYVMVQVGELYRDADGSARTSTAYFQAPLGLIYIPNYILQTNGALEIEVQGGDYKGVNATRI